MYGWNRVVAVVALAVVASACGRKPAAEVPTPPQTAAPEPAEDRAAAERAAREAAERAAAEAQREAARAREVLTARVYFDYDLATVREDARPALDAKASILRGDPTLRVRVEGHADERGSTEYNLALGSRRAQSVATYLSGYGVDPSRLETVSYGEERPLTRASTESAWSQNRRAEFVIIGGTLATDGAAQRQ
jgi:peptidoglycan-associated lipoprotein